MKALLVSKLGISFRVKLVKCGDRMAAISKSTDIVVLELILEVIASLKTSINTLYYKIKKELLDLVVLGVVGSPLYYYLLLSALLLYYYLL